jgi:hypothetical protein
VPRTQIQEGTGTNAIQEVIDVKEIRSRQLMSQSETSEYIFETQKLKDLNPTPLDTIISTIEESGARHAKIRQRSKVALVKHPTFIECQRLQLLLH